MNATPETQDQAKQRLKLLSELIEKRRQQKEAVNKEIFQDIEDDETDDERFRRIMSDKSAWR